MQTTVETAVQFDREYELAQEAAAQALARRNEAVLSVLETGVINQAALAERLGISPGRVSQIVTAARRRREAEGAVEEAVPA